MNSHVIQLTKVFVCLALPVHSLSGSSHSILVMLGTNVTCLAEEGLTLLGGGDCQGQDSGIPAFERLARINTKELGMGYLFAILALGKLR